MYDEYSLVIFIFSRDNILLYIRRVYISHTRCLVFASVSLFALALSFWFLISSILLFDLSFLVFLCSGVHSKIQLIHARTSSLPDPNGTLITWRQNKGSFVRRPFIGHSIFRPHLTLLFLVREWYHDFKKSIGTIATRCGAPLLVHNSKNLVKLIMWIRRLSDWLH